MKKFFSRILPSTGWYMLAAKNPNGPGFTHHPFQSIAEMVAKAKEINSVGQDVYHACASYAKQNYQDANGVTRWRTVENAAYARSFWLDIDCGHDKASSGKGYKAPQDAAEALKVFCDANKLPIPMIISSGGGLHCYWSLTEDVAKADWLLVAHHLKDLTQNGVPALFADPSRTADIASILRPVGTNNWKPERAGTEVTSCHVDAPIQFDLFKDTVLAAHKKTCSQRTLQTQVSLETKPAPPTLDELREMLSFVDPDCERGQWWGIIAAIADAYAESGRPLAREWSDGSLHNKSSDKYDLAEFEKQYTDALNRKNHQGPRIGLGSVIQYARDGGWQNQVSSPLPVWLADVNAKYAWIEENAAIYRIEHGDFIKEQPFKTQLNNQQVRTESITGSAKLVGKGTQWLKEPDRRQHKKLVLRPNEPEITADNCLNVWSGFAVEPVKGDVEPFLKLLQRLVPNRRDRHFVLQWLAHLVQKPNIKMHVALVIWSLQQGVGKNLAFECIKSIIGERHATLIGQDELAREFNGWVKNKVFVIGDEVSGMDRRQHQDKLKGLITGTTVQINEKHQPAYVSENLMNFVFLSNHNTAMFLGDHDRRYFVAESHAGPLPEAEAIAFAKWHDNGGLSHLLYYLQRFSLRGFNPKTAAPETAAKREMVADNRSDLEAWASDLMATGASTTLKREVATSRELAQRYHLETDNRIPSTKVVVAAFKRHGAKANQVRLADGKRVRLLALDRPDYWSKQPESVWASEMAKTDGKPAVSLTPHVV